MDGTTMAFRVRFLDPRSPLHPHQRWLKAETEWQNYEAYMAARPGLSTEICRSVYRLHDSAQYHFITMLLWNRGEAGYLTVAEALSAAREHHEEVSRNET